MGSSNVTAEKSNLIVFDMDDVLFYLNEKVARIKNIPYSKFTVFSPYNNPNLTEDEKQRVLSAYMDTNTYRDIEFIKPIIDLINWIYHECSDYQVCIISNNSTKDIRDVKLEQLREVLDLPAEQIHMHIIDMATQSLQKKLPDDMFIFVDDSPHNIILANAVHKIMPARQHNKSVLDANGYLNGCYVDRPLTSDELVNLVIKYIERG